MNRPGPEGFVCPTCGKVWPSRLSLLVGCAIVSAVSVVSALFLFTHYQ